MVLMLDVEILYQKRELVYEYRWMILSWSCLVL